MRRRFERFFGQANPGKTIFGVGNWQSLNVWKIGAFGSVGTVVGQHDALGRGYWFNNDAAPAGLATGFGYEVEGDFAAIIRTWSSRQQDFTYNAANPLVIMAGFQDSRDVGANPPSRTRESHCWRTSTQEWQKYLNGSNFLNAHGAAPPTGEVPYLQRWGNCWDTVMWREGSSLWLNNWPLGSQGVPSDYQSQPYAVTPADGLIWVECYGNVAHETWFKASIIQADPAS